MFKAPVAWTLLALVLSVYAQNAPVDNSMFSPDLCTDLPTSCSLTSRYKKVQLMGGPLCIIQGTL